MMKIIVHMKNLPVGIRTQVLAFISLHTGSPHASTYTGSAGIVSSVSTYGAFLGLIPTGDSAYEFNEFVRPISYAFAEHNDIHHHITEMLNPLTNSDRRSYLKKCLIASFTEPTAQVQPYSPNIMTTFAQRISTLHPVYKNIITHILTRSVGALTQDDSNVFTQPYYSGGEWTIAIRRRLAGLPLTQEEKELLHKVLRHFDNPYLNAIGLPSGLMRYHVFPFPLDKIVQTLASIAGTAPTDYTAIPSPIRILNRINVALAQKANRDSWPLELRGAATELITMLTAHFSMSTNGNQRTIRVGIPQGEVVNTNSSSEYIWAKFVEHNRDVVCAFVAFEVIYTAYMAGRSGNPSNEALYSHVLNSLSRINFHLYRTSASGIEYPFDYERVDSATIQVNPVLRMYNIWHITKSNAYYLRHGGHSPFSAASPATILRQTSESSIQKMETFLLAIYTNDNFHRYMRAEIPGYTGLNMDYVRSLLRRGEPQTVNEYAATRTPRLDPNVPPHLATLRLPGNDEAERRSVIDELVPVTHFNLRITEEDGYEGPMPEYTPPGTYPHIGRQSVRGIQSFAQAIFTHPLPPEWMDNDDTMDAFLEAETEASATELLPEIIRSPAQFQPGSVAHSEHPIPEPEFFSMMLESLPPKSRILVMSAFILANTMLSGDVIGRRMEGYERSIDNGAFMRRGVLRSKRSHHILTNLFSFEHLTKELLLPAVGEDSRRSYFATLFSRMRDFRGRRIAIPEISNERAHHYITLYKNSCLYEICSLEVAMMHMHNTCVEMYAAINFRDEVSIQNPYSPLDPDNTGMTLYRHGTGDFFDSLRDSPLVQFKLDTVVLPSPAYATPTFQLRAGDLPDLSTLYERTTQPPAWRFANTDEIRNMLHRRDELPRTPEAYGRIISEVEDLTESSYTPDEWESRLPQEFRTILDNRERVRDRLMVTHTKHIGIFLHKCYHWDTIEQKKAISGCYEHYVKNVAEYLLMLPDSLRSLITENGNVTDPIVTTSLVDSASLAIFIAMKDTIAYSMNEAFFKDVIMHFIKPSAVPFPDLSRFTSLASSVSIASRDEYDDMIDAANTAMDMANAPVVAGR